MKYRVMAWDGDFCTRDMFRADGRLFVEVSTKKKAEAIVADFTRFQPKGVEARITVERCTARYAPQTIERWSAVSRVEPAGGFGGVLVRSIQWRKDEPA